MDDLNAAIAELVEQRAQLEERLADFYRVASRMSPLTLAPAAAGALADLKLAIGKLDTDLTRLANAVHAIAENARGTNLSLPFAADGASRRIAQVVFVTCGESQFALPLDDVKEIRSWKNDARGLRVVKLESALQLQTTAAARKLVVLNTPPNAALLVDDVIRQDELLMRPAPEGPYCGAVSGLGGEHIPVLDTATLIA